MPPSAQIEISDVLKIDVDSTSSSKESKYSINSSDKRACNENHAVENEEASNSGLDAE